MYTLIQKYINQKDGGYMTQYLAVVTATVTLFIAGIHQGWPGPSLIKLLSNESTILINKEEASYITISGPLGHIIGGFIAMGLSDVIGKKVTVLLIGVPQLLSFLFIYFSNYTKYLLYIARIFGGIGEGASLALIPCYIAEVAEPSVRGKLGSLVNLSVLIGHLFINSVGSFLNIHSTAFICLLFPIIFWITFMPMPESPYYCLIKSKTEEARNALQVLRRKSDVEKEILLLSLDVKRQMSENGSYRDLFYIRTNRKALILATATRYFQIFTGSIALVSYQQIIISEATDLSPVMGSTILIIAGIAMVFLASLYVDKYDKKPLMVISTTGTALSLIAQAIFFTIRDNTLINVSALSWIPLTLMLFYNIAFRFGLGVLTNILISEIYSTSIKAKAISLGSLNFAVAMMTSTKIYQFTADHIGLAVPFYIFGLCTILGTFFFYYKIPETKGKTLEAIQQELKGNKCKDKRSIRTTEEV